MYKHIDEDDYLMLSGIQHMAFCERQWALIHIEQQWQENRLTTEGEHLHEHADNPFENDTRKEVRITRGVALSSSRLGLRGIADIVQYLRDDTLPDNESVSLVNRKGKWKIVPVEYKHGKPKPNDVDKVQLCAQAMCLEEMFNVDIKEGYIYYNITRRREQVIFDVDLKKRVEDLARKMHHMFSTRNVPKPVEENYCRSCSLYEICQPGWNKVEEDVSGYITKNLYGDKEMS
jgi:CRISPR-associated exonuclease Cas4